MMSENPTLGPLSALSAFVKRNERKLSFAALALGFIIDNFTLRRVDLYLENVFLVAYVSLVALSIVIINVGDERLSSKSWWPKVAPFSVLAMQFALGSLWSAFLVFYSRSATISSSWPFLLILVVQLIGNEFLRKQYVRLSVQVSIFYIVLFSYLIFMVPVLALQVSDNTFLLSGLLSLVFIWAFLRLLALLVPGRLAASQPAIIAGVGLIYLSINFLYFTNNIPPIPLSLKQSGIFHSIERGEDGDYRVSYEWRSWREFLESTRTVHVLPDESIVAFNAIFAPSRFSTSIIHQWQEFVDGLWQTRSRIVLPILGGRDFGFRTFSQKSGFDEGLWRVSVETLDGRVIGRIKFNVVFASSTPDLVFASR
jgi:hypothetical protein